MALSPTEATLDVAASVSVTGKLGGMLSVTAASNVAGSVLSVTGSATGSGSVLASNVSPGSAVEPLGNAAIELPSPFTSAGVSAAIFFN